MEKFVSHSLNSKKFVSHSSNSQWRIGNSLGELFSKQGWGDGADVLTLPTDHKASLVTDTGPMWGKSTRLFPALAWK